MRLNQDGAHAGTGRFASQIDIVVATRVDIRCAVHVQVDGAFQKIRQHHRLLLRTWIKAARLSGESKVARPEAFFTSVRISLAIPS
jgi:hypothetical protein